MRVRRFDGPTGTSKCFHVSTASGGSRSEAMFEEGDFPPPNSPDLLERKFQTDLHDPLAPRANERIASREVRGQERSAKHVARTRGVACIDGTRSARGIGGDG